MNWFSSPMSSLVIFLWQLRPFPWFSQISKWQNARAWIWFLVESSEFSFELADRIARVSILLFARYSFSLSFFDALKNSRASNILRSLCWSMRKFAHIFAALGRASFHWIDRSKTLIRNNRPCSLRRRIGELVFLFTPLKSNSLPASLVSEIRFEYFEDVNRNI